MAGSSKKAIYAALVGNSLIAVTKFIAATLTGSAAMFSEGIHSLVDTGNQVLLLYGLRRAELPASPDFPFGHGKEVYFWSFVVAILIFGLGAGISIYQGWHHIKNPAHLSSLSVNYLVLAFAIVFESGALWVAAREFAAHRGALGFFEAIRQGKDPSIFVVLFEDSAALLGLFVALAGIALYQLTGNPIFDGLASISIGVILAVTAAWLAWESKGLLIGEAAASATVSGIRQVLEADSRVKEINEIATLHMGPNNIIVTLSVDFIDGIDSYDVESAVTQISRGVKEIDSSIRRVFVEIQRGRDHSAS